LIELSHSGLLSFSIFVPNSDVLITRKFVQKQCQIIWKISETINKHMLCTPNIPGKCLSQKRKNKKKCGTKANNDASHSPLLGFLGSPTIGRITHWAY